MNARSARDARVEGRGRIGQLEVSGEGQAEGDAYFSPDFRFHGPHGRELDYEGLKGYFAAINSRVELARLARDYEMA